MNIVRRCCFCEHEFGIQTIPEASHGTCARHLLSEETKFHMGEDLFKFLEERVLDTDPLEFSPDFGVVFDG
jgi:hypothetical protein